MNDGLFKFVAYAAKTRLNESGFKVRSGHIHEIIAALHGYDSNAAFRADNASLTDPKADGPVVVLLDIQRASDRVTGLLPDIGTGNPPVFTKTSPQDLAAHAIAKVVSDCFEATSTEARIHLALTGINCDNAVLDEYARSIVLADPIMAGVIDDPEARYRSAIDEGFSDDMAKHLAKHGGALKFPFSSCGLSEGRLHIELADEYSTPDEQFGVVRVYLEGGAIGDRTYVIDHVRTEFAEGDYFDHIPEFSSYSSEDWD